MSDPVETAQGYLGAPYKFGGSDRSGIDCSGLVAAAYPGLPRTAREQYNATQRLSPDQLQRGDLVYLTGTQSGVPRGQASHVGIYDGAGGVIAAPHTGGRVSVQPLSQWQGKNLLGYGRVATMPGKGAKGKIGPTSVPQRAPAAQDPGGYPGGVMPQSPAQGGDIYSYLRGVMDGRPQPTPLHLYDPFSPTTAANPDYNPTPDNSLAGAYGASQSPLDLAGILGSPQPQGPGPVRPYNDQQTVGQPSLYDQYSSAATSAQQQAPNPMAAQVAEQKARSGLHKSLADLLAANPAAQYELPAYQPFPDRQQAPIPTRPAPRYDPMSGGLATLAALFDPQNAGNYGAAPLEAGLGVAQQQYGDSLQHYQMQAEQMAQQYEHDLAKRNDLAHYLQEKAGVGFENKNRTRDAALLLGQTGAQGGSEGSLADMLQAIGEQSKGAGGKQLQADLLNQEIQRQLGANAAQVNYGLQSGKQETDIYKTLLQTMERGYNSDNRTNAALAGVDQRAQAADLRNQLGLQLGSMKSDLATSLAGMHGDLMRELLATRGQQSLGLQDRRNAGALAVANARASYGSGVNPRLPANLQSDEIVRGRAFASASHEADKLAGLGVDVPPQLQTRLEAAASAYNAAQAASAKWLQEHPGGNPSTRGASGAAGATRGVPGANGARPHLDRRITGAPILGPDGRPFLPLK